MESIQDFISLVAACTIAMVILHALCYVMKKIRNFAVQLVDAEIRQRIAVAARDRNEGKSEEKKQPVEHDEPRIV